MNAHLVSLPNELVRLAWHQSGPAPSGERHERSSALIVALVTFLAAVVVAWL